MPEKAKMLKTIVALTDLAEKAMDSALEFGVGWDVDEELNPARALVDAATLEGVDMPIPTPEKTEHTPGPWRWHDNKQKNIALLRAGDKEKGQCIPLIIICDLDGHRAPCEADKDLIAAAPETAAELEKIREERDRLRGENEELAEALKYLYQRIEAHNPVVIKGCKYLIPTGKTHVILAKHAANKRRTE